MPADAIVLTRCGQVNLSFGSIFAFNSFRTPEGDVEVKISVQDEENGYDRWIRIGEEFIFGGRVWKLDDVENAGQEDWVVLLVRVD